MDLVLIVKLLSIGGTVGLILLCLHWIYKKGKETGYKKGREDERKETQDRDKTIYNRLDDPSDSGIIVQKPDAKWGMPDP